MDAAIESAALYSIEDAARILGKISSWTLRKHLKRGSASGVRIGRRIFLGADEIRRIQAQGLPSLSDQPSLISKPRGNGDGR